MNSLVASYICKNKLNASFIGVTLSSLCVFSYSDLTMEIVRYRLIGPLSYSVLNKILIPATDCEVSRL